MMKTGILLTAAAAAACIGAPASAKNRVKNGSFSIATATGKTAFASAGVANWSGSGDYLLLDPPGTADDPAQAVSKAAVTSRDGGNFVQSDGNYAAPLSQTITGLTIGQAYVLTFYQAVGELAGVTTPSGAQWMVTFGTQTIGSTPYTVTNGNFHIWTDQWMTFVATADTQVLSFQAKGLTGVPAGVAFLDGVSLTAVPEPASWGMMILGFGAIGGALRRRRTTARIA